MFDKNKNVRQPAQEEKKEPAAPVINTPSQSVADSVAMIGQGISITGDVTASSNLKVSGRIEGRSISSSHDIEVADSGVVKASITAKVVRISGTVTGDVSGSEKVVISKSGRVQGNIVAPRVQLDDGALFRGSIDMNPAAAKEEKKPVAAKPVADAKPAPQADKPAASNASLNLKSG